MNRIFSNKLARYSGLRALNVKSFDSFNYHCVSHTVHTKMSSSLTRIVVVFVVLTRHIMCGTYEYVQYVEEIIKSMHIIMETNENSSHNGTYNTV